MRALVWFRSDLRTRDNTALHHACRASDRGVVALFVVSHVEWRAHEYAAAKVDFLLRTLAELSGELRRLNIALLVRTALSTERVHEIVCETAREHTCDAVFFNKEYEVNEAARDRRVMEACRRAGLKVHACTDQTLIEPGEVRTGEGKAYTVFTPFKKACVRVLSERPVREWPAPKAQPAMIGTPDSVPVALDGWASTVPVSRWATGERAARALLAEFIAERAPAYKHDRDFPALNATSGLSPHLTVGSISARQCVAAAMNANSGSLDAGGDGLACWISEVLWREFSVHVVHAFPRVCMHRAFQPWTERVAWQHNDAHLEAWKEGRTGVPIVDAGMRQLLAEGWMHNRIRMVTAMYLSKNLLLDWRLGEAWFMRHLVDGFLASNNGGWQWSASTGTDAAPYFRIFNPVSQSEKFDKDGVYIRRYVSELREVEGDAVHDPSRLAPLARARIGYPEMLVDLSRSRQRAIEAFRAAKG